jgi:hypothetical protein
LWSSYNYFIYYCGICELARSWGSRSIFPLSTIVFDLDRERQHLTRGRVDASPERLRPEFDGGTGARTARTANNNVVRLYPHFEEEHLDTLRNVVYSESHESNEGTG